MSLMLNIRLLSVQNELRHKANKYIAKSFVLSNKRAGHL